MDQRVFEACFAQLKAGKWHKTNARVWCTPKHGIVVMDAQSGKYLLEAGGRSTEDGITLEVTRKQVAMKAGPLDIAFKFHSDTDAQGFVAELHAKIPHALGARSNRRKKQDRAIAVAQASTTGASAATPAAPNCAHTVSSVSSLQPSLLDVSLEDLPDPSSPVSQRYLMSLLCDPLFARFTTQVRCAMLTMHARTRTQTHTHTHTQTQTQTHTRTRTQTQTHARNPTAVQENALHQNADSGSGSDTDDGGGCAEPMHGMSTIAGGDTITQRHGQESRVKRDQGRGPRLLPPSSHANVVAPQCSQQSPVISSSSSSTQQ